MPTVPASKPQRLATAQRRARCVAMRGERYEWHEIARELGYANAAAACKDYRRAMEQAAQDLGEETATMRAEQTVRLQAMAREVWKVARREHVVVSHGKVVRRRVGDLLDDDGNRVFNDEGEPVGVYEDLLDDAPILQAVDRLLKIEDQLSGLWGTKAAVKIETEGHVAYSIEGVDLDALR